MRIRTGLLLPSGFMVLAAVMVFHTAGRTCDYNLCSSTAYGEYIQYTINQSLEIHSYTLMIAAGDVIKIRMNRYSGSLAPDMELITSDDRHVVSGETGIGRSEIRDFRVENGGTYRLLVSDVSGSGIGVYGLSVQSTNRPANARPLLYDGVFRDTVVYRSEMIAYRVEAKAGDEMDIQAVAIEGGLGPRLELYRPDGGRVAFDEASMYAHLSRIIATEEGLYTLIVSDDDGLDVGEYVLILQRTPTDAGGGGEAGLPDKFAVSQNYPNPFNPRTVIEYTLPRSSEVSIVVFNILGEKVRTLVEGTMPAGRHAAVWDGKTENGEAAPSGMYLYRIEAGEFLETRKMQLLK